MDFVRSALQTITHNFPTPIRYLGVFTLGQKCYTTLLLDIDPSDGKCVKLAISKGLGISITSASFFIKAPEILALTHFRSVSGISPLTYLFEIAVDVVGQTYNVRSGFPISTFGEIAVFIVQNILMSLLVLKSSGNTRIEELFPAGIAVSIVVLLNIDMKLLSYLQAGAGVLRVAIKVSQIAKVRQQRGTIKFGTFELEKTLGAFIVFTYLAGSLLRIFTTLQEVDDKLILYGFVARSAVNAVLAAQLVYYWNASSKKPVAAETTATLAETTATPAEAAATLAEATTTLAETMATLAETTAILAETMATLAETTATPPKTKGRRPKTRCRT